MKRGASLSPELGNDSKRLRRSGRQSAGRKSLPHGYLATDDAVKEEVGRGSDSDDDSDDSGAAGRWSKQKKRTFWVPSPEPEPLLEDDYAAGSISHVEDETTEPAPSTSSLPPAVTSEVSLTFNVPTGHTGPFVVKLNLSDLQAATRNTPSINQCKHPRETGSTTLSAVPSASSSNVKTGFLDLAPELRHSIYRQVLISEKPVSFPTGSPYLKNPAFPTALLATCHQIELEASQILYGDQSFQLSRDHRERGTFFDRDWREIGFLDARLFLQRIGPRNIGNIRNLTLVLADGKEDKQDYSHRHRAVNDDNLITILKLLAKHGRLQSLYVRLQVRKSITKDDARFLVNLQAVRADVVKITGLAAFGGRFHYPYEGYDYEGYLLRLADCIKRDCLKQMKRTTKMYPCYTVKSDPIGRPI